MSVSCMPVFRQMGRIKKVVLSQNKAPITGTIPELMPSAAKRRQDISLQLLSELIK